MYTKGLGVLFFIYFCIRTGPGHCIVKRVYNNNASYLKENPERVSNPPPLQPEDTIMVMIHTVLVWNQYYYGGLIEAS